MLSVESLIVKNGQSTLLGPISLEVPAGEALVIMGETGAGKSLIAQAILGALPKPLSVTGSISLSGTSLESLDRKERELLWGTSIASLPQEPWRALSPLVRSYDQVFESHHHVAGLNAKAACQFTDKDFEKLNLQGAQRKRPGELSGGMGQRVAFAAALAGRAPVLLADEPTKGLDENRKAAVIDILKKIPDRQGSLIVITHDVSVAKSVGGKILVLRDGALVEEGDTKEVLSAPRHDYTRELIEADPSRWEKKAASTAIETFLELDKLVSGRDGSALTKPVDLKVTRGRRVAITGSSGKGKSTLLDTIANLISPISGSIVHHDELKSTDIQKIYQDPPAAFASRVSLKSSLNDVAKLHNVGWQTVEEYLKRLGIGLELLERRPNAVSGGELQRIAIARALIVKPKLILADEPTSRLDPITQKQTMDLLADVANENDTAILLVTHDSTLAENWTEETVSLD